MERETTTDAREVADYMAQSLRIARRRLEANDGEGAAKRLDLAEERYREFVKIQETGK